MLELYPGWHTAPRKHLCWHRPVANRPQRCDNNSTQQQLGKFNGWLAGVAVVLIVLCNIYVTKNKESTLLLGGLAPEPFWLQFGCPLKHFVSQPPIRSSHPKCLIRVIQQRVGIVSWVAHCTQETSLLASPSGKSTTKMRQQFDSAATWKIQWVAGRGCSCADCSLHTPHSTLSTPHCRLGTGEICTRLFK